jgi:hypothetical protein
LRWLSQEEPEGNVLHRAEKFLQRNREWEPTAQEIAAVEELIWPKGKP